MLDRDRPHPHPTLRGEGARAWDGGELVLALECAGGDGVIGFEPAGDYQKLGGRE